MIITPFFLLLIKPASFAINHRSAARELLTAVYVLK